MADQDFVEAMLLKMKYKCLPETKTMKYVAATNTMEMNDVAATNTMEMNDVAATNTMETKDVAETTEETIRDLGKITEETIRELGKTTAVIIRKLAKTTAYKIKDLTGTMAETIKDITDTTAEKKNLADATAENIEDEAGSKAGKTEDVAKTTTAKDKRMAEARTKFDYDQKLELLREAMKDFIDINPVFVEFQQFDVLRTESQSDCDSSTGESGTETVTEDGEQGSPIKKPVEPESPAPARMEGLIMMTYTPDKDGFITESKEDQLKREIEARRVIRENFEKSLINANKLPEKPRGESADSFVTTAESSSALSTEQAIVEDLIASSTGCNPREIGIFS